MGVGLVASNPDEKLKSQILDLFKRDEINLKIFKLLADVVVSQSFEFGNDIYYKQLIDIFSKCPERVKRFALADVSQNSLFLLQFCQKKIECLLVIAERERGTAEKISFYKQALQEDQNLFLLDREITGNVKNYAKLSCSNRIKSQLAQLCFEARDFWAAILFYRDLIKIREMEISYENFLEQNKSNKEVYQSMMKMAEIYSELKMFESCSRCGYEAIRNAPPDFEIRSSLYRKFSTLFKPSTGQELNNLADIIKTTEIYSLTTNRTTEFDFLRKTVSSMEKSAKNEIQEKAEQNPRSDKFGSRPSLDEQKPTILQQKENMKEANKGGSKKWF